MSASQDKLKQLEKKEIEVADEFDNALEEESDGATESRPLPEESFKNDRESEGRNSNEPSSIKRYENSKLFKKFIAEESKKLRASPVDPRKDPYQTPNKSMNAYEVYHEVPGKTEQRTPEDLGVDPADSPVIPSKTKSPLFEEARLSSSKNDLPAINNDMGQSIASALSPPNAYPPMQNVSFPYNMGSTTTLNPNPNNSLQMQEYEHGMIIAQYDSLLQQLTGQLEKQIKRNKELENIITVQAQKSTKLIETLRGHAEEEIADLSRKLDRSEQEKDELKARIEELETDHKHALLEKEQENQLAAELRRKLDSDGISKLRMSQIEDELRKVISQVNGKNVELEADLRKKDEEIFSLNNACAQLKTEVTTYKGIIAELKEDYSLLMQKKGETDMENQRLMAKIYTDEIGLHKLAQENERLVRTVGSLNDAKDAVEKTLEEVKNENLELKQVLAELDKEKTLLTTKLEKSYRDYQTLEIALMKAENTARLQTETINELQYDYSVLLEKEKLSITPTKDSDFHHKRTPPRKPSPKMTPKAKEIAVQQAEQEDLKSRYREYKQRQNTSALGDVFKWNSNNESLPSNTRRETSGDITMSRQPGMKEAKGGTYDQSPIRKEPPGKPHQSAIVTLPSNKKFEENKDQIAKLQSNLQTLLAEKQKLEKDYSKFGPRTEKSMAQRKRKEEVEFDLDLTEKNIQRVKHKLRELNAFS